MFCTKHIFDIFHSQRNLCHKQNL